MILRVVVKRKDTEELEKIQGLYYQRISTELCSQISESYYGTGTGCIIKSDPGEVKAITSCCTLSTSRALNKRVLQGERRSNGGILIESGLRKYLIGQ